MSDSKQVEIFVKQRNASVELLRCLLMFLVVFHHSAVAGLWGRDCSQHLLMYLGSCFCMFHVDGFVGISGWFGIKFGWRKFLGVWGQLLFYSMLSAGWLFFFQPNLFGVKSLVVKGGWFASSYLVLMILAPMLNAAVDNLVSQGKHLAFKGWLVMAIGVLLASSPMFIFSGIGFGPATTYSPLTLIFVYITARLLNKFAFVMSWWRFIGIVVCYFTVTILGYACYCAVTTPSVERCLRVSRISGYLLPHVWIMALALVMIFSQKIKIYGWLARAATFFAPSMFGIYLLHLSTSFGFQLFRVPEAWLADHTRLHPVIIVLCSASICYCFCLIVDLVRRFLVFGLKRATSFGYNIARADNFSNVSIKKGSQ